MLAAMAVPKSKSLMQHEQQSAGAIARYHHFIVLLQTKFVETLFVEVLRCY
ncbi:MAG: hypothetical protein F6K09_21170 [Merismopedia sp. SIO2A8]|nr:hypothetical protein [Symploca sp. SIO2B6]NET51142.1 hypothetical protein [Merismopedia sp. SIO2A8]